MFFTNLRILSEVTLFRGSDALGLIRPILSNDNLLNNIYNYYLFKEIINKKWVSVNIYYYLLRVYITGTYDRLRVKECHFIEGLKFFEQSFLKNVLFLNLLFKWQFGS